MGKSNEKNINNFPKLMIKKQKGIMNGVLKTKIWNG